MTCRSKTLSDYLGTLRRAKLSMAIRGKGLFLVGAGLIKLTHSDIVFFPFCMKRRGNFSSSIPVQFSKCKNKLYMPLLDNGKWKNQLAKCFKIFTKYAPYVSSFSFVRFFCSLKDRSFEMFLQKVKTFLIGIDDNCSAHIRSVLFPMRGMNDVKGKRSFSIDKPSSVGKNGYFHVLHGTIPQNRCLAATQQAKGREKSRNGALNSWETLRGISRESPRNHKLSCDCHKSNRLTYVILTDQLTLQIQDPKECIAA
jgi:hypothetical protein